MQDANRFNEDLIKGLVLELHKGMDFVLTQVGKQIDGLRTELGKQIDDLRVEMRFDMSQVESRLNHRIDGVSTKVDRVEKKLSTFRKDTNGQLHEIRSSLLRIDKKLCSQEERLLNLERL